ncbi:MAG: hypothetical protein KDA24_14610 [Deltaproteobacteria bacterium]|nr:hypothetical protein [Deltaproteobacteria bacterium]
MRSAALLVLACLAVGCSPAEPEPPAPPGPLGIVLADDGLTRAGAAVVDITPEITETYTDLNGDYAFDGCLDDPEAVGEDCDEPFDDVNGNGWFDATFIGGFGPLRPALDVHDPISARALLVAEAGEYIAFVTLDIVGLGSPRIHPARDALAASGFDPDRLIVSSSHNHQGPDTMGLWGDPYDFSDPISGIVPAYSEQVTAAIEQAVRDAAASMEVVDLRIATVPMRDRSVWFSSAEFGGKNPVSRTHGMVHDIRDPIVVSDQLLVLQGVAEAGTVFTMTSWSGHPEVRGSDNDGISADWPGVTRDVLEAQVGGVALHLPESLGGMMSALGADLPLVTDEGVHVMQTCSAEEVADADDAGCFGKAVGDPRTDADGDVLPVWAERDSWEFVTSHGWHIAEAALAALETGETISAVPLRTEVESFYVPIQNLAYQLLGPSGIFDLGFEDAVVEPRLCPEIDNVAPSGCIESRTFRVRMGPLGLITVPGELLPELFWGLPTGDPQWVTESADPEARGAGSRYFPQHDGDCDEIDYSECTDRPNLLDCDCLAIHAWPYTLSPDLQTPPMKDLLDPMVTPYRAAVGMVDNYLGYIIPEPDFNTNVSLVSDRDGDHYEDTVSPAQNFATRLQEAQLRISERW